MVLAEIKECNVVLMQFPQIGELLMKRLILNFKKGFRRNDKAICLSSVRFIAHLVNQQVVSIITCVSARWLGMPCNICNCACNGLDCA